MLTSRCLYKSIGIKIKFPHVSNASRNPTCSYEIFPSHFLQILPYITLRKVLKAWLIKLIVRQYTRLLEILDIGKATKVQHNHSSVNTPVLYMVLWRYGVWHRWLSSFRILCGLYYFIIRSIQCLFIVNSYRIQLSTVVTKYVFKATRPVSQFLLCG